MCMHAVLLDPRSYLARAYRPPTDAPASYLQTGNQDVDAGLSGGTKSHDWLKACAGDVQKFCAIAMRVQTNWLRWRTLESIYVYVLLVNEHMTYTSPCANPSCTPMRTGPRMVAP
eukprot:325803-Chlamydomonas_euryale.AAC.7